MKLGLFRGLGIAAAILLAAAPAVAHHSFSAEYDSKKPVTLTGIVTKVDWMNPHVYFYIDVKDESGNIVNWALEMGPPTLLQKAGWTRNLMKVGDELRCHRSPRCRRTDRRREPPLLWLSLVARPLPAQWA